MSRALSRLVALLAGFGPLPGIAAQTTEPVANPEAASELPAAVRDALATIQDFAFNFDHPGFYAMVEFVKRSGLAPGMSAAPIEVKDWRDLLERPGEFRGRPVTIEGIVGRNKDPYLMAGHEPLGRVSQVELRRGDQPIPCTLILTEDVRDLPIGANIRVTGYFVMMRQYYGAGHKPIPAALIVARGPSQVSRTVPLDARIDWRWIAIAVVAALIITILLLRGGSRKRPDLHALRGRPAPLSVADEFEQWAAKEAPDKEQGSADRAGPDPR
jgi:hypothetical protein